MIKFSSTSDFNFGIEPTSIIKDVKSDLQKRGSYLGDLKFEKTAGQTDLHMIALGAYEGTGDNRNGDRFCEKACKDYFHTFKEANRAFHRHHKNKPNDPKYGNIKAAAYNEPMKRVELIVGLDNDKCADILDEQEKKGQINVSMACKIPWDRCTTCGHKAKDDDRRCEHIPHHLGEMDKKGNMCAMDNEHPSWFEISYVYRPADRIGMSLKYASERVPHTTKDYLNIYKGFEVPKDNFLVSKKAEDKRNILHKLAELEKHVESVAGVKPAGNTVHLARTTEQFKDKPKVDNLTMDELRKQDPSKVLKTLADHGIIFSLEDFVKYIFGDKLKDSDIKETKKIIPTVFSKTHDSQEADDDEVVNNEKYDPSPLSSSPADIKDLVSKLFNDHSLFDFPTHNRVMRITIIRGGKPEPIPTSEKEDVKEAAYKELAKEYTAYKLATLNYLKDNDKLNESVLWNVVLQNR